MANLALVSSLLLFFTLVVCSTQEEQPKTFIIRAQHDAKPTIFPTHRHWYESTLTSLASPEKSISGNLIHVYSTVFHGFSAKLKPSHVDKLKTHPGILAVINDQARKIQTTRSPQFLGLKIKDNAGLLAESDFGSDLVIGVIDTGIWPERRSFSDSGLGPVPAHWKGECVAGRGFPSSSCNRKLVGARYFSGGYEAMYGPMNETVEFKSPRDTDGHGTHTASIAAGRYVFRASTLGYANGVAAGMAPKARLAAYKVCWNSGCFDSDILAAFDSAVNDGVDVISLSVGGVVVPYYLDPIAIGAFAAMERGIFVSASAGNGGPGELTVTNVSPWITTVGAGTMDRNFPADIKLGNGKIVPGVSVYSGPGLSPGKLFPLVYAGNAPVSDDGSDGYSSSLCMEGSLNPSAIRGKIVLCDRGVNPRAAKGYVVRETGGVGMILANGVFDGEGLVADSHVLPATSVGAAAGDVLRRYINTAKDPKATIIFRGTQLGVKPAPVIASFSSRGPNPQSPDILKPDVIAPGLNILAAWPDGVGPSGLASDKRRTEFNILSGTSMACPHVSGLAALLKGAHPNWSPAAIRSALMTTAYIKDNRNQTMLDEATGNSSSVLDFGSGHVDPQKAMDPGLVYDLSLGEYVDFLCRSNYSDKNIQTITRKSINCRVGRAGNPGNLNYPSFAAVFVQSGRSEMSRHFIRTVTNVGGEGRAVYKATVSPPSGIVITVEPKELVFRRVGQRLNYLVRVQATKIELSPGSSKISSGFLSWSDGKHLVNSPIVVTVQAPFGS